MAERREPTWKGMVEAVEVRRQLVPPTPVEVDEAEDVIFLHGGKPGRHVFDEPLSVAAHPITQPSPKMCMGVNRREPRLARCVLGEHDLLARAVVTEPQPRRGVRASHRFALLLVPLRRQSTKSCAVSGLPEILKPAMGSSQDQHY